MATPQDALTGKGDSPRPPVALPEGGDGSGSSPSESREILTPNAASLQIPATVQEKDSDPVSSPPKDSNGSLNDSTIERESPARRKSQEEEKEAEECPEDKEGSASSDDDSDEISDPDSDEDDDDDSSSEEDADSDDDEDSDDEDEDDSSDEESQPRPTYTAKRIGRIRPQTTRPVIPTLVKATGDKPGASGQTGSGMKLTLPKNPKVSLPLPLNQLATPNSQNSQSSGTSHLILSSRA